MHVGSNTRLLGALALGLLASASCTLDGEAFNGQESGPVEEGELAIARTTAALVTNNCGDMSGIAASAPWPMKGGCSSHAAQASTHGTKVSTLNWSTNLGAAINSSPAVGADGTIYVGANNGILYAINPSGSIKWQISLGGLLGLAIESSPTIAADGTIYVGANLGLYAINPNGTQRWFYGSLGLTTSSPVVAGDGTIYFGSTDLFLYAFNPDGTKKWPLGYALLAPALGAPAVGPDGTVYIGSGDNAVNAIRPDGTNKWAKRLSLLGAVRTTPTVVGDRLYVGSDNNAEYALSTATGAILWERTQDNIFDGVGISSSAAIGTDGTVYFGAINNRVNAYSPAGVRLWTYKTGGDVGACQSV